LEGGGTNQKCDPEILKRGAQVKKINYESKIFKNFLKRGGVLAPPGSSLKSTPDLLILFHCNSFYFIFTLFYFEDQVPHANKQKSID